MPDDGEDVSMGTAAEQVRAAGAKPWSRVCGGLLGTARGAFAGSESARKPAGSRCRESQVT